MNILPNEATPLDKAAKTVAHAINNAKTSGQFKPAKLSIPLLISKTLSLFYKKL